MSKEVLGLVEKVVVKGLRKYAEVYALVDTGATSSSIDLDVAAKLNLVISGHKAIKRKTLAGDVVVRPTVSAEVEIKGKVFNIDTITVADRSFMNYPMLIGRDILKGNFVVDVSLNSEDYGKHKEKVKYYDIE